MATRIDDDGVRYLACDHCNSSADKLYDFGGWVGELCYDCGIARILTDNPELEVWDAEYEIENHYETIKPEEEYEF
ncbi:MAG: hypothetical protein Q4E74_09735 [Ruminococcus sp.]|nr:hypothetical protein [Ruminococcus sp.]